MYRKHEVKRPEKTSAHEKGIVRQIDSLNLQGRDISLSFYNTCELKGGFYLAKERRSKPAMLCDELLGSYRLSFSLSLPAETRSKERKEDESTGFPSTPGLEKKRGRESNDGK